MNGLAAITALEAGVFQTLVGGNNPDLDVLHCLLDSLRSAIQGVDDRFPVSPCRIPAVSSAAQLVRTASAREQSRASNTCPWQGA